MLALDDKLTRMDERIDRTPRPLTPRERETLDLLVAHDFLGCIEIREQARDVLGMQGCLCPCGSFDLIVDPATPDAPIDRYPTPVGLTRWGSPFYDAEDPHIEVTLWAREGRLTGVEVTWYTDEPRGLPDPAELSAEPPPGWTDHPPTPDEDHSRWGWVRRLFRR